MKRVIKLIIIFTSVIIVLISSTAIAASVTPIELPGNDIQDQEMITPPGCVFYSFEDNSDPGTYTVEFSLEGEVEPGGPLVFTAIIGQETGTEYTQLLSWSANFPVYAVTVKGGPNYNLYIYDTATSDTNLVAPNVSSGEPADVSHTSLIFCPPIGPTPTPVPTSTPTPIPPYNCGNCICLCLIWIVIAIIAFILGMLIVFCRKKYFFKRHHHKDCH